MRQTVLLLCLFLSFLVRAQDGTTDGTFGSGGVAKAVLVAGGATANVQGDITRIIVLPDGKILQAGYKASSTGDDFILIRYTADGIMDLGFGIEGGWQSVDFNGLNDRAHSLAVRTDGRILVAGEVRTSGGKDVVGISGHMADGSPDLSFDADGKVQSDLGGGVNASGAMTIEMLPDGKFLIGGYISNGISNDFLLARYLPNGTLDAGFGTAGKTVVDFAGLADVITDLEVLPDGRILAGGTARLGTGDAFALAMFTSNGSLDPSFNGTGKRTGVAGQGRSIDVSATQLIYITGLTTNNFTTSSYNLDGSVNTAFNGGTVTTDLNTTSESSRSVLVQCDGKILVGGEAGPQRSYAVARYQINGALDLTFNGSGYRIMNTGGTSVDWGFSGLALQPGKILMGGISFLSAFSFRFHPTIIRLNNASTVPNLVLTAQTACAPSTIDLTASSVTTGSDADLIFSYWTDANATTVLSNPNAIASSGTYYIKGTTPGGCYIIKPVAVTISPAASGSITPASATICAGGAQTLTANGGASYQWYRDGTLLTGATGATYSAAQAGVYSVDIINGSCSAAASNTATITVTNSVTPTIQFSASPSGTITSGTMVTFTATIANGGSAPIYQWQLNGFNTGTNSPVFSTNALVQGDVVTVTLTSNAPCANPVSVTSTSYTASVQTVTPSVSVTASASGPVCAGTMITYTATPVNGGTAPVYQWKLNGTDVGINSASYTAAVLSSTDEVWVVMTSNAPGANPQTVTSNHVAVTVQPQVTPSVSISVNPGTSFCEGTFAIFTAQPINGGNAPVYEWRKNNVVVGGTASVYTNGSLANGDVISLQLTSNAACASPVTVSAAPVTINVTTAPQGNISPATASICPGGSASLTATAGFTYQWYRDGNLITGATSASYNATLPGTYSVMLSIGNCTGPAGNTSVVSLAASPSGSIQPAAATICAGTTQIFTASGGTTYQWFKDAVLIPGATAATYSASVAGQYTVMLINGNCSGPASNAGILTVQPLPSGNISPAQSDICAGGSQLLTTNGGSSYQWFRDGALINGPTAATYNAAQPGTYSVIITNGNCSAPASNVAVVNLSPAPQGTLTPASATICTGGTLLITATGGTAYQWFLDGVLINGATAATYTASQAGSYTAMIYNGNCSGMAANASVITTGNSPSGTISPATGSICAGGSILLTATGGNTYQWYLNNVPINGATSSDYTATQAGTYSVIISNGNCSGAADNTSVITSGTTPTGSITPASASICPGASQLLTASGGSSYQWSLNGNIIAGATGSTYNATLGGQYQVTIYNGNCSGPASNEAGITVLSIPASNITPATATVCEGVSQIFTASGTGTFQWYRDGTAINGATGNRYTASASGGYTVQRMESGCSVWALDTVTLTVTPLPQGTVTPASATICAGGSQQLTATGGSSYQWLLNGTPLPGATSATLTALQPGSYSVTITDAGCSAPAANSAIITLATAASGNINPATATICSGGSQLLTASGGGTYQWYKDGVLLPGATTAVYTATASGTYSVIIFNGSCSGPAANEAIISTGAAPAGSITPATADICAGGTQTFTASGGNSYQWYHNAVAITGATGASINASQQGQYSVTIFSGSCSGPASNTASLTISPLPSGSISPAAATLCTGGNITLTATGGQSYQWLRDGTMIQGATASSYNATQTGTYTVNIINGNCSALASNSSVVTAGNAPSGNISPASSVICPGDSVVLTATGGGTYQWFHNNTSIAGANAATFTALQTGTYSVIISNGSCSGPAANEALVNAGTLPSGTITPSNASICTGDSVQLSVSGGNAYEWFRDAVIIPGATGPTYWASQSGSYTVKIINGGCSAPAGNAATVVERPLPSGSVTPASASVCNGDAQLFSVTGGQSYQWYRDNILIPGATASSYSATLAGSYSVLLSANGCSDTSDNAGLLNIKPLPSGTVTPLTASICSGGAQVITVNGGTAYQWSRDGVLIPGATGSTYTATQAGKYTAAIFDNGCWGNATDTSVISSATAPNGTISPASSGICSGGSQLLTVTGGTTYQWRLNGTDIAGATSATYNAIQPGTYSAIIYNGSCSGPAGNVAEVTLTPIITPTITLAANPAGPVLPGTTINFTATITGGGSSPVYQWEVDGNPVGISAPTFSLVNPVNGSVVRVRLVSSAVCAQPSSVSSNAITVLVIPYSQPSVTLTADKPSPVCSGATVNFTATPAFGGPAPVYQWLINGVPIVHSGASYATDSLRQGDIISVTMTSNDPAANPATVTSNTLSYTVINLVGAITPASASICNGDTITITANGGDTYQWFKDGLPVNGQVMQQLRVSQAGTYTVRIYRSGCSSMAGNAAVVSSNIPSGTISPATATICPGGSQLLTATGGDSYEWYLDGIHLPGASGATFNATRAGLYSVVLSSGGCRGTASNTASITEIPLPSGRITPAIDSICAGDSIQLLVDGGTGYQWLLNGVPIIGATNAGYMASAAGTYSVQLSNGNCTAMAENEARISLRYVPGGMLLPAVPVAKGKPFLLQARSSGINYLWQPAAGLDDPTLQRPTVTTNNDRTYTVRMTQASTCAITDTLVVRVFDAPEVYVPTGFTPNNDGRNDILRPVAVHVKEIRFFRVVNRWGEVVYETKKAGEGWNGIYKGQLQATATFVWFFEGVDADGKIVRAQGTSTLIR